MRKLKFLAVAAIAVTAVGTGVYASVERSNGAVVSDAVLANVEALADGEGPTSLGCKPYHGATCYVFDGNGQLVDKKKNQYPG